MIGRALRLTETRGSPRVAGLCPRLAEEGDLLGLKLVEGNVRVLEEESRAHQVHPLLSGPDSDVARAGAPPDALREAGRLRLNGQHRIAGAAAHVGTDDAGAGDRGPEQCSLLARLVVVDRVAECLGSVPGGLGGAATDAELEPAAGEEVRRGGFLRHVERVLVAHVDHAGADLDPARLDADRSQKGEGRGELAREVMDAHERPVDPDLLGRNGELDGLAQCVCARMCHAAARMPGAEGERADLLVHRYLRT